MKRSGRRQWRVFPWAASRQLLPATDRGSDALLRGRLLPPLTVVLPVRNQSEFLAESVTSVLTGHSVPLELIVIDDGSTEAIESVLSPFLSDPRVYFVRQPNGGLATALNRGFGLARGSLLTWTSADNRYLPGALDVLAGFLLANPQVDLTYGNVRLIDEAGNQFPGSGYRSADQRSADESEFGSEVLDLPYASDTLSLYNDNFVNACFLFRRRVLERCGRHLTELRGYEDYEFWLRASVGGRLAHVDTEAPLYDYRLHRQSLTAELASNDMRTAQGSVVAECEHRRGLLRDRPLTVVYERTNPVRSPESDTDTPTFADLPALSNGSSLNESGGLPASLGWLRSMSKVSETGLNAVAVREVMLDSQPVEPLSHLLRSAVHAPQVTVSSKAASPALIRASAVAFPESGDLPPSAGDQRCTDESRELLVLPPVTPPAILRRARDSHFSAVTAHADGCAVVLVPVPAWRSASEDAAAAAQEELVRAIMFRTVQYVSRCAETTFVLLATDPEERKTADAIHLSLLGSQNLRILDLSDSQDSSSANGRRNGSEPLLYAFGSVDALFLVGAGSPSLCSLLELRSAAAFAALAGMPIIWGEEKKTITDLLGFDLFNNSVLAPASRIQARRSPHAALLNRVAAHVLPMPHLWLHPIPRGTNGRAAEDGSPSFADIAQSIPDYSSLEQYIASIGYESVATELSAFPLSQRLDRPVRPLRNGIDIAASDPQRSGTIELIEKVGNGPDPGRRHAPNGGHAVQITAFASADAGRSSIQETTERSPEPTNSARFISASHRAVPLSDQVERGPSDHPASDRAMTAGHPPTGSRKLSLLISNLLLRRVNE